MIKLIKIIEDGQATYKEVTKDDILIMFDGMYGQFANRCVYGLAGYLGSSDDYDDYKQMAMIKATNVFEKYDITRDACFSKALFESYLNLYKDLIREKEALKRKVDRPMVNLNATVIDGEEISSVIADSKVDDYFKDEATDLEKFLLQRLTKEEILYYTMGLKKQVKKSSKIHKACLEHSINMFTQSLGVYIPEKKEELAIMLGLSRPTLNKRIKETVVKVRELAVEFCVANMELSELPF